MHAQLQPLNKQKGFTLIEVGIALAIGLVVILGVAKAIQKNQTGSDVAATVQDVQYILQGAIDWRSSRTSYSGISMSVLNTQELVPSAIGTGSSANRWGGNYTVSANTNASKVDISITNVPTAAAAQLEDKLDSTSDGGNGASVSGSTVTVTY